MKSSTKSLLAIAISLCGTSVVSAQCPDGTPPPCDTRRSAAMTLIPRAVTVPSPTERGRRFLVLPFRNVTKQPDQDWLVEGSTTMLVEALGKWQGISVVPDEKLYPALKRAGIAPGTVADAPQVRRVAEETGGWTAVTGEVLSTGGRLRITARAWDIPTSRELVRASSEIPTGGDVRAAYDSISLRLLRSAGIDSVTSDLATTTTRNLDAYRGYLSGIAHMRRSEIKSALKDFQEAIKGDSGFALAWARLAEATLSADPGTILNPQSPAAQYSKRAVALSAKLPARERQLLLASDAIFGAQFADARRILEALVAADSNDVDAMSKLAGLESFDPILLDVPGGKRPRQSANREARLAKRVAELDPSRNQMYGMLAQIYASAGVPGSTPTIGIDRAPSSFPDLIQSLSQREHVRIYIPLYADTLFLVPAESLSAIPKDSIAAMRKNARVAARAWADRWLAATTGEAAPYQMISELASLDHDYPAALRALAKADSLGVQTPTWTPQARRMLFLAKSGNLAAASRLADSLTTAGFFAVPTNMMTSGDAATWAFALEVMDGRLARAGALLDQQIALRRLIQPALPPEFTSFVVMMGNDDPADEPGVPRSMRGLELDNLLSHIVDASASPQLGQWLPMMLPLLAENADTTKKRLATLLKAADELAAAGHPFAAFSLASNTVSSDSTLEPEAAKYAWYRAGAEAYNGIKRTTQNRFRPATATITTDRAVFEWAVADSAPFNRNRVETPIGRGEYRWEATVDAADKYYRFGVSGPVRSPGTTPASGTVAEIFTAASPRYVISGKLSGGIQRDTTSQQGMTVKTEFAPGVMRMVVTDRAVIDALLKARPKEARFRFTPCVRAVGSVALTECVERSVSITYP